MSDKSYAIKDALCFTGAMTLTCLLLDGLASLFKAFSRQVHDERNSQRDLRFVPKMTKENFKEDLEAYYKKIEKK